MSHERFSALANLTPTLANLTLHPLQSGEGIEHLLRTTEETKEEVVERENSVTSSEARATKSFSVAEKVKDEVVWATRIVVIWPFRAIRPTAETKRRGRRRRNSSPCHGSADCNTATLGRKRRSDRRSSFRRQPSSMTGEVRRKRLQNGLFSRFDAVSPRLDSSTSICMMKRDESGLF